MGSSNTKEQIELQALIFFATNDFERSSLNDIAKALNVTKGAIYHYFEGKDALFKASVLRLLNLMEEMFSNSLPGDIPFKVLLDNLFMMEEAMEEFGRSVGLEGILKEYKNLLYLFMAALKKFPEIIDRLDHLYSSFRTNLVNLMNAAIVRGEIRMETDTVAIAYEITAFYEGALLLGAFSHQKDYIELGPRVCSLIWERIAVKDASENPKKILPSGEKK